MTKVPVSCIVAATPEWGIGVDNQLPWRLSQDMKFFTQMTSQYQRGSNQNVVIMGRNTWESIPPRFRPLKDRKNVVISSQLESSDCTVYRTLEQALEQENQPGVGHIFIIGGAQLYRAAMPLSDFVFLTVVQPPSPLALTTFMDPIPITFAPVQEAEFESIAPPNGIEKGFSYAFKMYAKLS